MKLMNDVHEDKPLSLKEKILREVGERLVNTGEPCWLLFFYEPILPPEIIEDVRTE